MKTQLKTAIAACAVLAMTGFASAQQAITVTEADMYGTNLEPGYSTSIDLANVPALDDAVMMEPEFERPNNFMSDEGVYRYAYFEKTGIWLTLNEARAALASETPAENI